ncbi:MAG TPA: PPOX class F420-dependent oxidoreductase [Ktedonobacteraceae bacterium]|nr:PPOX class F420-dependent oxidoreductase [Ktedonobacteraceae bacterium]
MHKEELEAFLAKPNDAIIAVNRPEKGAQLTPVWFLWDGGVFYFSTQKATAKYFNMKRDPKISVMINDTAAHSYVTAHGQAEILEMREVNPELAGKMLEKYVPEEQREQFAAMIASAQTSERVVIKLRPEKMVSFIAPAPSAASSTVGD